MHTHAHTHKSCVRAQVEQIQKQSYVAKKVWQVRKEEEFKVSKATAQEANKWRVWIFNAGSANQPDSSAGKNQESLVLIGSQNENIYEFWMSLSFYWKVRWQFFFRKKSCFLWRKPFVYHVQVNRQTQTHVCVCARARIFVSKSFNKLYFKVSICHCCNLSLAIFFLSSCNYILVRCL